MENNAIMNNEVIETTEEVIENTGMSKGIKIAAGVGLSVIVGFVVYKYVAKPVIANIKTQIELKKMAAEEKTIIVDEADVSTGREERSSFLFPFFFLPKRRVRE